MGYLHINNLYKDQAILAFKECYALEKIHGTSAHIKFIPVYRDENFEEIGCDIQFFSGGEKHERFLTLFDQEKLKAIFLERYAGNELIIFGEAYGGKQQGMSATYGQELKFIAFDVKIGDSWLDVPNAFDVVSNLGLEFVDFVKIPTDLEAIDAERDKPSVQAKRNGIEEDKTREGVVLRPTFEVTLNNGSRLIVKHKGDEFKETSTARPVVDPAKMEVLKDAERIAEEWVTVNRLKNAESHFKPEEWQITNLGNIIRYISEDIEREGEGELTFDKTVKNAISKKTASVFKMVYCKLES